LVDLKEYFYILLFLLAKSNALHIHTTFKQKKKERKKEEYLLVLLLLY